MWVVGAKNHNINYFRGRSYSSNHHQHYLKIFGISFCPFPYFELSNIKITFYILRLLNNIELTI